MNVYTVKQGLIILLLSVNMMCANRKFQLAGETSADSEHSYRRNMKLHLNGFVSVLCNIKANICCDLIECKSGFEPVSTSTEQLK